MSGTAMPEAAIQEDCDSDAREDDIWPRQGNAGDTPVDEVAESQSMKPLPDSELKGSVSALGVSHTPGGGLGAGLWCVRGHRAWSVRQPLDGRGRFPRGKAAPSADSAAT